MVVRRLAGQVRHNQPVRVSLEELLDRRGAVVGGAILDQEQRLGGLGQHAGTEWRQPIGVVVHYRGLVLRLWRWY